MPKQADVLYDGDDYMILVPNTAEAAAYFGKNTNWCTSGEFEYYNDKGNLIIILRRKDGKDGNFILKKINLWIHLMKK